MCILGYSGGPGLSYRENDEVSADAADAAAAAADAAAA